MLYVVKPFFGSELLEIKLLQLQAKYHTRNFGNEVASFSFVISLMNDCEFICLLTFELAEQRCCDWCISGSRHLWYL